jgi:hypothetical protein
VLCVAVNSLETHSAFATSVTDKDKGMSPLVLSSVIAIIAGVLIFIYPRLLSQIVALYLITVGVLGLIPFLF